MTLGPRARMGLGIAVGATALVWLFHDIPLQATVAVARRLAWPAASLAVAADLAAYACQGLRWRTLLASVGDASWLDATEAIYAGLFANELLPLRPGEALRAWIMARRLRVGVRRIVPSVVVERLFDGFWLTCGLAIAALAVDLPSGLADAAEVFGVALMIALVITFALSAFLAARPGRRARLPALLREPAEDLAQIGSSRAAIEALALSLGVLLFQALAFWFTARAVALPLSFAASVVVLLVLHLGTLLPNAPANLGTFQLAVVLGLTLFGIDKATAAGFSMVVFVLLTAPLWALGAVATWRLSVYNLLPEDPSWPSKTSCSPSTTMKWR
jgi:glycosyltransferase 2 family protein